MSYFIVLIFIIVGYIIYSFDEDVRETIMEGE